MSEVERWGPADARAHVWFLHGILGQGRNWRSLARRLADEAPGVCVWLPDLRGHGALADAGPPWTLSACADALEPLPEPAVVVGHSFGGKVALRWLEGRAPRPDLGVVVLDSPPGGDETPTPRGPDDPARVLQALREVGPAADREALRRPLLAAGVSAPVVAWLSSGAVRDGDGWRYPWDLDGVEAMLRDYLAADFWPLLAQTEHRVVLVRAGRSDRWTERDRTAPTSRSVTRELSPEAGHWVHVDDPDGTLAIVRAALDTSVRGGVRG